MFISVSVCTLQITFIKKKEKKTKKKAKYIINKNEVRKMKVINIMMGVEYKKNKRLHNLADKIRDYDLRAIFGKDDLRNERNKKIKK
jgi:hypothetical protein